MSSGAHWRIRADTGGTFTDCVGVTPDGTLHRAKVLSSSRLRARVTDVSGERVTYAKIDIGASGLRKDTSAIGGTSARSGIGPRSRRSSG